MKVSTNYLNGSQNLISSSWRNLTVQMTHFHWLAPLTNGLLYSAPASVVGAIFFSYPSLFPLSWKCSLIPASLFLFHSPANLHFIWPSGFSLPSFPPSLRRSLALLPSFPQKSGSTVWCQSSCWARLSGEHEKKTCRGHLIFSCIPLPLLFLSSWQPPHLFFFFLK